MTSNVVVKSICLTVLTLQTTFMVLLLRYSRTQSKELYRPSTAVLLSEEIKFSLCISYLFYQTGFSLRELADVLYREVFGKPKETLKLSIPSFLYTIQNNLLFLALTNLDAATYQVTYQLKILTTAIFSVILLHKSLLRTQWLALILLMAGVAMVQMPADTSTSTPSTSSNTLIGVIAVLVACLSSGFSGVYYEKLLKQSTGAQGSIIIRNIQLGMFALIFAAVGVYYYDGDAVQELGFFYGHNRITFVVVLVQAVGGLLIAVTVKYADNILKGFATSISIILSSLISYYILGDLVMTLLFGVGTMVVICSTFLYGYTPPKSYSSVSSPGKTKVKKLQ